MAVRINITIWNTAEESNKQTFDGTFTDEVIERTIDEEALDDEISEFVLDSVVVFMDKDELEVEDTEDEDEDEDDD